MSQSSTTSRSIGLGQSAGYFAAFVALGIAQAALGPTLPDLAARVHADLQSISYGLAAHALGYLAGSVVGGQLYDRVRGHPVMAAMLALLAGNLFAIPLIPFLPLLIVTLFALGFGAGALDVGGNTLIVWVHGRRVSPYMNALHFFFGVGAFLAPVIIAQAITRTGSIQWAYWSLAFLILPVALLILLFPSPSNVGIQDNSESENEESQASPQIRRDWLLVALIALFFFVYVGAEGSFGGWIATYARESGLGNAAEAAYLTSVFWGALTLGRFLSVLVAMRLTPRQVLATDLLGVLLSVVLLSLGPHSRTLTWLGAAGAGLSMASIFPTTLSLAERHMTISGAVTSLFFVGASTGGMVIPWAIGQLFGYIGPRVVPAFLLAAALLDIAIFSFVVIHTRRAEKGGI